MFDEFVDNTERYEEFIEELLEANREGRFDDVFNRAYGMGTFSIDELIDIYAGIVMTASQITAQKMNQKKLWS